MSWKDVLEFDAKLPMSRKDRDWELNFNRRLEYACARFNNRAELDRLFLEYLKHYLVIDSEYQDPKDPMPVLREANGL